MASANSLVKRMVDHLLSSQYIPSLEGKLSASGKFSRVTFIRFRVLEFLSHALTPPPPQNGWKIFEECLRYRTGEIICLQFLVDSSVNLMRSLDSFH